MKIVDLSHTMSIHTPGWVGYAGNQMYYAQNLQTKMIVAQRIDTALHVGTHIDALSRKAYWEQFNPAPEFIWQSPRPSPKYDNPQLENYYDVWAPAQFGGDWNDILDGSGDKLGEFFNFFVNKELALCLLGLPFVVRDRHFRFLVIQFLVSLAGLMCVVWFWPHYAAPMLATIFALLVQGMRHMRRWRVRGWASAARVKR